MSKPRKTVEVAKVLASANFFLEHSPDEEVAERQATANLLEVVLHMANAYAGFRYLPSAEHQRNAEGYILPDSTGDESRRFYYANAKVLA